MSEEKVKSMGIKGFLLKPVVMRDLSQKIRQVLNGKIRENILIFLLKTSFLSSREKSKYSAYNVKSKRSKNL